MAWIRTGSHGDCKDDSTSVMNLPARSWLGGCHMRLHRDHNTLACMDLSSSSNARNNASTPPTIIPCVDDDDRDYGFDSADNCSGDET